MYICKNLQISPINMSLVVFGVIAFDDIKTPAGERTGILGGTVPYSALSASHICRDVKIISVVGDDFSDSDMEIFSSRGISTEGILRRKGMKSFHWKARYHENMDMRQTLETRLGALDGFDPVVPESYGGCDILLLANSHPGLQRTVIERVSPRPRFVIMDTMNFWMDTAWSELIKTLSMTDILVINDQETVQLSGMRDIDSAARKILYMGPKWLIVKKGGRGAVLYGVDGRRFDCPVVPLDAVTDPTGAGDTFAGGFAGYLCDSGDYSFEGMKRAMLYGTAMASFCVEKFGTENLTDVSGDTIDTRVGVLDEMIRTR